MYKYSRHIPLHSILLAPKFYSRGWKSLFATTWTDKLLNVVVVKILCADQNEANERNCRTDSWWDLKIPDFYSMVFYEKIPLSCNIMLFSVFRWTSPDYLYCHCCPIFLKPVSFFPLLTSSKSLSLSLPTPFTPFLIPPVCVSYPSVFQLLKA